MNKENHFLKSLSKNKIYIHLGHYDFRCGIDTLVAASTAINCKEFYRGALFAYCSKGRRQIRLVFWQGCGAWMITRKIESCFNWPNKLSDKTAVLSCYQDLISLLADPISEDEIERKKVVNKLSNY